ncbi:uncharacterized protein BT62DRAFT_937513 [Guyanagaster necrorhizus]|uniref:Uncharacterized protein n=1 Tax=Guyanagaster necrorhizus TaxID=856835 RepID=A0A9P7VHQ5_9AGAR|nr:uncharacterized protein BT62DRAFT_937513 [Guyanagaster necrorhizus MCA 3950]KAG7440919.1 hypothetical protein BT62DRAFT_937513 [Guyanagaster necrorhizus MCA 3950]
MSPRLSASTLYNHLQSQTHLCDTEASKGAVRFSSRALPSADSPYACHNHRRPVTHHCTMDNAMYCR